MKPPIQEQIESLIHGDLEGIVKKYTGIDLLNDKIDSFKEVYAKVFTVKKPEIKQYLKTHYQLRDLIPETAEKDFFAEKAEEGFDVYEQDWGHILPLCHVNNEDELLDKFIDFIINRNCISLSE